MDRLRLKTALVTRGHTQALKDGTVKPRTFDFDFEEVPVIIKAFRRMVRGLEFDISEMAITTYICARAHGKAFTALPIFPMRAFHHGAIVYNTKAGIRGPKDLEGKRVGRQSRLHRDHGPLGAKHPAAPVRRGLEHDHVGALRRRARRRVPAAANVVPIEKGKKLEDMLVSGEIPAAIGVQVDSPDVKPLIPNAARGRVRRAPRARALSHQPHRRRRNELLTAHPGSGADIFDAFAEAKRLYVAAARGEESSSRLPTTCSRRVMEITGDPLPYGVEPNRQMLEAVIRHSRGAGDHRRARSAVEELFPRNTLHSRLTCQVESPRTRLSSLAGEDPP